jgi:protein ImuA
MPEVAQHPQLEALLQHPSLWRGRGAAPPESLATGYAALDAMLPGGGWPRRGLVEILTSGSGCGELTLWAPLIARCTGADTARWCAFVTPPFEPYAPAWRAQGARLDRLLIVRAPEPLWALEQSLLSGVCALGFAWPKKINMTELRRLALASERGAALAVLIRPVSAALEHSAAVLRIALTRTATRLHLQLLKGRGLSPRAVELAWS